MGGVGAGGGLEPPGFGGRLRVEGGGGGGGLASLGLGDLSPQLEGGVEGGGAEDGRGAWRSGCGWQIQQFIVMVCIGIWLEL